MENIFLLEGKEIELGQLPVPYIDFCGSLVPQKLSLPNSLEWLDVGEEIFVIPAEIKLIESDSEFIIQRELNQLTFLSEKSRSGPQVFKASIGTDERPWITGDNLPEGWWAIDLYVLFRAPQNYVEEYYRNPSELTQTEIEITLRFLDVGTGGEWIEAKFKLDPVGLYPQDGEGWEYGWIESSDRPKVELGSRPWYIPGWQGLHARLESDYMVVMRPAPRGIYLNSGLKIEIEVKLSENSYKLYDEYGAIQFMLWPAQLT